MKGATLLAVAVMAWILASSPASGATEVYSFDLATSGGVQLVVNGASIRTGGTSTNSYRVTSMTINPNTGMLYVSQNFPNSGTNDGIRAYDSGTTSLVTAPTEATAGSLDTNSSNEFTGSVQSGLQTSGVGDGRIGFNPAWTNSGGTYQGSLVQWSGQSGANQLFNEWVGQSAAREWGELEEGTTAGPLNTAARFASFGVGGHPWGGGSQGLAYIDRENDGGNDVDRWFSFYDGHPSDSSSDGLRVYQTGVSVSGADNTTVGARTTTNKGRLMYVDHATNLDFVGLVDGVSDTIVDIAVRPHDQAGNVFDVFFLSYDGANSLTYLSAIRATLPVDPSGWSFEQIDIDGVDGGAQYIQLRDTVADIDINGKGIAFSGDGSLLYVASDAQLSTGNAAFDDGRIYIFQAAAIPEPATLALLTLGGLALTGTGLRRRMRR